MATEAEKAAKARYDAKTARYVSLKLNRNTDQDIIDQLEAQEFIQAYIKGLIRNDIQRGAKTMYEFVKDLFDNCQDAPKKMSLAEAKTDLDNFTADGWNLPEGITAEAYMEIWNGLVNERGAHIASGYTPDGEKFELVLIDSHLYIRTDNGDDLFNDEYYDEDDSLSVKPSMISDGYKFD